MKITRGNPRSKVLQMRLNPDEYAAIEPIAERRSTAPAGVFGISLHNSRSNGAL
jgi:hypothetical protein